MQIDVIFNGFQQRILIDQQLRKPKVSIVTLDASTRSTLKWENQIEEAQHLASQSYDIVWEFSFGEDPLIDEVVILTLEIAVEHFTQTIWPKFVESSFGVILYRGALNLVNRDAVLGDLKYLAACLPESLPCFLCLDLSNVSDPATYFQLTNQDVYGHLHLIIEGKWQEIYPFAIPSFTESFNFPAHEQRISTALYLPQQTDWEEMNRVILSLKQPFRVIPEKLLIYEWEGIDHLIVCSQGVSDRGRRKLAGFCAAGGEILTVGEKLGLPNERFFSIQDSL